MVEAFGSICNEKKRYYFKHVYSFKTLQINFSDDYYVWDHDNLKTHLTKLLEPAPQGMGAPQAKRELSGNACENMHGLYLDPWSRSGQGSGVCASPLQMVQNLSRVKYCVFLARAKTKPSTFERSSGFRVRSLSFPGAVETKPTTFERFSGFRVNRLSFPDAVHYFWKI